MEETAWFTGKRQMLGGDCLSLSTWVLFSAWLWNKQDTYHCPECTHLSPHSSSLTSPAMPALLLSQGLMCRCPITAALTSLRQRDCQWHWGGVMGADAWANDSWKTAPPHFTGHHTHIFPVGQFPSSRSGTPSNFERRKSPIASPCLS